MPDYTEVKKQRVGFYVEVEIETFYNGEAPIIAERILGWPGSWSPAHDPVIVHGVFGNGGREKEFDVKIIRSEALMVRTVDEDDIYK